MKPICYMVTATFPSPGLADEFVAWLEDGHIQQVIDGGAESGTIVRLDPDDSGKARVMAQYTFASREKFDTYVATHAPALRADGLKRFGPERGVTFERRLGTIVGTFLGE